MASPTASPTLTPELIADYTAIMTRINPNDWDGMRRRVDSALRLAQQAFVKKHRPSWEVVQVIEWRLQRQSSLRPTDPSDVLVLDALYRTEEAAEAPVDLPRGLTPRQFCDKLTEDISIFSAVDSPTIQLMNSGKLTKADWQYMGYQWLAPSGDFTRQIALASLPLPPSLARFMYHNLFDEAGKGVWEKTHYFLLQQFLRQFDVKIDDEEEMLYWTVPEQLGMINAQNRMLWHREPAWPLGSLYLCERLLPFELGKIRDGLLLSGVKQETLAWFDEHIVVDVSHAEDWLGVVEAQLTSYEDQQVSYLAAMTRGRWAKISWDSIYPAWQRWKETGVPPHAPARELRQATGL